MILTLASKIYEYFVSKRNEKFDKGIYNITECKAKVISIGNVIAGGTGKTPFTIFFGQLLKDKNVKVGIVGSGYGRKKKGLKVVCDGEKIVNEVEYSGDELALIAQRLMVPVVVDDKKYLAAKYLDDNFNVDVIIVDDGFQHRYLKRDLDIVLISETTLEKPYTFPKGMLREPLENSNRADILCFENKISEQIIFKEREKITYIKQFKCFKKYYKNEVEIIENISEDILLTSSIARPKEFEKFILSKSIKISKSIFFKDHYDYKQEDINKIVYICKRENAKSIITTEKDFVKLFNFKDILFKNNISIIVSEIEITIDDKEKLTNLINSKCNLSI